MASMMRSRVDGIASLSSRAVGAFVDTVVIAPIVLPVTFLVHPTWLASVIVIAVGCMYQIPQIAMWGMTPGARAAGVRVTREDGRAPGWLRAAARWVTPGLISNGYRLAAPGPFGLLAGAVVFFVVYAPALLDPRRRALIDRVAGTIVVDRAQSLMSGNVPFGNAEQFPGPEHAALKAQRRRGLVIVAIVVVLVSSSLTWWAWATSRADHQAKQQAVALETALKGLKPYQVLLDPGRSLGPNVNLVTMFGDPTHVVIRAQPRSLPHLRCVVANLDASGRYDVQIKDSGCGGR